MEASTPASAHRSHSAIVPGWTVIPSTPGLPLLALTCRNVAFRFSRSHTSSIHRFVLAGLSVPLVALDDSVSSLPPLGLHPFAHKRSPVRAGYSAAVRPGDSWPTGRSSTRTFDPCFLRTPPRGGSPCIITRPSPPSGWPEDLHLQTAEHSHTYLAEEKKLVVRPVVQRVAAVRFLYRKTLKRRDMKEDLPSPRNYRRKLPWFSARKKSAAPSIQPATGPLWKPQTSWIGARGPTS